MLGEEPVELGSKAANRSSSPAVRGDPVYQRLFPLSSLKRRICTLWATSSRRLRHSSARLSPCGPYDRYVGAAILRLFRTRPNAAKSYSSPVSAAHAFDATQMELRRDVRFEEVRMSRQLLQYWRSEYAAPIAGSTNRPIAPKTSEKFRAPSLRTSPSPGLTCTTEVWRH